MVESKVNLREAKRERKVWSSLDDKARVVVKVKVVNNNKIKESKVNNSKIRVSSRIEMQFLLSRQSTKLLHS